MNLPRILAVALIGVAVGAALVALFRRRSKHRRAEELTQHPERLEQMLDPTDDA